MSQNEQPSPDPSGSQDMYSKMAKLSMDFWQTWMQDMLAAASSSSQQAQHQPGSLRPFTIGDMQQVFQSMQETWSQAGLLDAEHVLQGLAKTQEMTLQMNQIWLEESNRLFQNLLSGMSQSWTEDSQAKPENPFQALTEFYSQSLHKMLHMPKLGLNRYSQERVTQALDRLNIFSTVANEFSLLMLQPVGNSMLKMLQQIQQMAENGDYFQEAKEYYAMWIKLLEGDYMHLLQSPEFVHNFHKVVHAYLEFKAMHDEVVQEALQSVPIAKKKEIEELYHENHLLKQELKSLARRVQDLESKIHNPQASEQRN